MQIKYFFSAPGQDIPVTDSARDQPFLVAPDTPHPFLSLGDYLDAIAGFLLDNDGRMLAAGLRSRPGPAAPQDIRELIIRTEKHGALYHIASAECRFARGRVKLALTTAVTRANRSRLTREFALLRDLYPKSPDALPTVYSLGDQSGPAMNNGRAVFTIMLGQWLDDFHEWHLARAEDHIIRIRLWDYERGYCFLDSGEEAVLISRAAAILTRHYDLESGCQIYPWHHAAGDFVVSRRKQGIRVRLVTVRDYAPILSFPADAGLLPGLITFFLHLTLRLRLDRLDGVGAPAWLAGHVVPAIIAGFFSGLEAGQGGLSPAQLLDILKIFSLDDLQQGCGPLLALYQEEDPGEAALIRSRLADHCCRVRAGLKGFFLKKDNRTTE
ncbi:MAG: hypothetical protein L3J03_03530 [Desulfobacterales bacterium]|nr:hypothetical protein [Desulfobacterales bacterium]